MKRRFDVHFMNLVIIRLEMYVILDEYFEPIHRSNNHAYPRLTQLYYLLLTAIDSIVNSKSKSRYNNLKQARLTKSHG